MSSSCNGRIVAFHLRRLAGDRSQTTVGQSGWPSGPRHSHHSGVTAQDPTAPVPTQSLASFLTWPPLHSQTPGERYLVLNICKYSVLRHPPMAATNSVSIINHWQYHVRHHTLVVAGRLLQHSRATPVHPRGGGRQPKPLRHRAARWRGGGLNSKCLDAGRSGVLFSCISIEIVAKPLHAVGTDNPSNAGTPDIRAPVLVVALS
ncbi:hypothetical protein BC628DRAFT_241151 [Trametes gibbosa]|nr:hypothetical protein BC628DRAFT_241151 [Trametes gibbosa]